VGKPERPFFDMAIKTLGLPPNQVVMIGDSIETDIGGAQRAGIEAILVRTGNYQFLSESESGVIPDHMIDSIADLPVLFS
jgi:ribonucleotide monophosphatase NagD (HAD superfamily)